MRVSEVFADNVAASKQKKLITISSKMGSIGETQATNSIVYRSSKAAVNMVMKVLANDLGAQGVIVTSFHPGWVRTDMGGSNAPVDAPTSASGLKKVMLGIDAAQNGGFFDYTGAPIPW